MYPGLPSRLEKEVKQLYLQRVLKGDTSRMDVSRLALIVAFITYKTYLTVLESDTSQISLFHEIFLFPSIG
jgi:hypothetical protein